MNKSSELANAKWHVLVLKVAVIIMLLRNLDMKRGLCNGTRLVVCGLHRYFIEVEILAGAFKGNVELIPRIKLAPSDVSLPFVLQRIQFPVRVAYAMTINKAQAQTFDKVGFNGRTITQNVVFEEVLSR